jgi:endonuclease YncB( thermonuclease family)
MGWKLKTLAVVIVVGVVGAAVDDQEASDTDASDAPVATSEPTTAPDQEEPSSPAPARDVADEPQPGSQPTRTARPKPESAPEPRTHLVTRVIDGDTVELASGAGIRVVGIDTPEEGDCGYDEATANMERLVLMRQVTLVKSDEDTDRYGRLLRYVDRGKVDAGLGQITSGWAVARYDSRDGYGAHARENRYIAADEAAPDKPASMGCAEPPPPQQPPAAVPAPAGNCASGYRPCIPPYPPDLDCGEVNGPIAVTGSDPHGLDADGDEVACE